MTAKSARACLAAVATLLMAGAGVVATTAPASAAGSATTAVTVDAPDVWYVNSSDDPLRIEITTTVSGPVGDVVANGASNEVNVSIPANAEAHVGGSTVSLVNYPGGEQAPMNVEQESASDGSSVTVTLNGIATTGDNALKGTNAVATAKTYPLVQFHQPGEYTIGDKKITVKANTATAQPGFGRISTDASAPYLQFSARSGWLAVNSSTFEYPSTPEYKITFPTEVCGDAQAKIDQVIVHLANGSDVTVPVPAGTEPCGEFSVPADSFLVDGDITPGLIEVIFTVPSGKESFPEFGDTVAMMSSTGELTIDNGAGDPQPKVTGDYDARAAYATAYGFNPYYDGAQCSKIGEGTATSETVLPRPTFSSGSVGWEVTASEDGQTWNTVWYGCEVNSNTFPKLGDEDYYEKIYANVYGENFIEKSTQNDPDALYRCESAGNWSSSDPAKIFAPTKTITGEIGWQLFTLDGVTQPQVYFSDCIERPRGDLNALNAKYQQAYGANPYTPEREGCTYIEHGGYQDAGTLSERPAPSGPNKVVGWEGTVSESQTTWSVLWYECDRKSTDPTDPDPVSTQEQADAAYVEAYGTPAACDAEWTNVGEPVTTDYNTVAEKPERANTWKVTVSATGEFWTVQWGYVDCDTTPTDPVSTLEEANAAYVEAYGESAVCEGRGSTIGDPVTTEHGVVAPKPEDANAWTVTINADGSKWTVQWANVECDTTTPTNPTNPTTPVVPTAPTDGGDTTGGENGEALATTGADGAGMIGLAGIAVALLVGGGIALAVRKRREA